MVKEKAYTPKSVSIGPFHHDLQESRGVRMQKLKYLKKFCSRTGKSQKDLASFIEEKEEKIRRYYSETFELSNKEFVEIILLDGIFIIELLWRNFKRENPRKYGNDYILSNPWLESHIKQDLILLENQLPFIILQNLYEFAFDREEVPSFIELACQFFFQDKQYRPIEKEVKHFTDLKRMFYSPTRPKLDSKPPKYLRYTATKLYETGLEFEAVDIDMIDPSKKSLLDIEFANNKRLKRNPCLNLSWLFSCLPCLKSLPCSKSVRCILKVPTLVIDEQTEALFRNLMALEQCHYPSNTYICNYVLLMDYLITTKEDVCLLVEKNVIVNRRGSSKAVTTLINTLGHEIVERESCYHELYQQLNDHCDNPWNRLVASLTSVYFKDFWRGTATIAGIFILGVTFGNFLRPFLMKN
jgi:hypothetical protein